MNFQLIGTTSTGGIGVAAYKNLAFTGLGGNVNGVAILDISNPANPVLVGQTPPIAANMEEIRALRIGTRDVLVVSEQTGSMNPQGGLRMYDIGDPAHPVEIGFFPAFGGAYHFEIARQGKRTLALLGAIRTEEVTSNFGQEPGTGDLIIGDISDPTNPLMVGEWGVLDEPALGMSAYLSERYGVMTNLYAEGVSASPDGRYAYLTYYDLGVVILDISNPAAPRYLGRAGYQDGEEGNAFEAQTARGGTILLRANLVRQAFQTQLSSNALTRDRTAGEDQNTPAIFALPGNRLVGDVVPVGRGCPGDPYLADPAGKLALIQFTAPREPGDCSYAEKVYRAQQAGAIGAVLYNPTPTGGFNDHHGPSGTPGRIVLPGNITEPLTIPSIAVGRDTGLCLEQVPDGEGGLLATDCTLAAPVTLTATSNFSGYGGIDIFDIRNPAQPIKLSTFNTPNGMDVNVALTRRYPNTTAPPSANHMVVVGNTVYAGWWGDGFRAIDISDPAHPREIGAWTGEGASPGDSRLQAWEPVIHNGMILLNSVRYGLYILNVVR